MTTAMKPAVGFQVLRYEPKNFRQRCKDANGEWQWKLNGVRRVPYRLPELLESVTLEHPVFVVEGEKSADALAKCGVTATCSPMGACKWRDEYSQHLNGADVVILPDSDEPGEEHLKVVARSLTGVAARIWVLRLAGLPHGGDVYDWLQSGGNADKLWQAVDLAEYSGKPREKVTGWRSHVFTAAALQRMAFPKYPMLSPASFPKG